MWDTLAHAVREGLRGLRRHPSLALASTVVLAGVLFLAAVFLLGSVNLMAVVRDIQGKVDMVVLLAENVPPEVAEGLATIVDKLDGVEEAHYVSAEEVIKELATDAADRQALLQLLGESPFPASLELRLGKEIQNPENLERLSHELEAIPGVEAAHYGKEWVEPLAHVINVVVLLDGLVGGVVVVICVVVAWGGGRLAVYGRGDVVELMRLTGAGRWHLASPFAVEGAVCGLMGGVVAMAGLYAGYIALGVYVTGLRFLPAEVAAAVPVLGAALGSAGSLAALRR